jgi:hypothetical protein
MKRRTPSFAALLALFAFVFAQMLAAAYACEMGTPAKAAVADAQSGHDCCDPALPTMDPACDNHCQQASKTADRVHVSAGPATPPAPAVLPPAIASPPSAFSSPPARAPDLARHIAPPIAIRNCCFRI